MSAITRSHQKSTLKKIKPRDRTRLSFWFICGFSNSVGLYNAQSHSFLFTLEEFGREALFLLDTVEEVSYPSWNVCLSLTDGEDCLDWPYLDMGPSEVCHAPREEEDSSKAVPVQSAP